MKKRFRIAAVILAALFAASIVTACGGNGGNNAGKPAAGSGSSGSGFQGGSSAADVFYGEYTGPDKNLEVNLSSASDANCQYLLNAFDRIEARTDHKVKFNVTLASGLLSTADALEGLGSGIADISDLTLSNYPESFVYTTQMCSQPFMGFKDIYSANDIIRDVLINNPNELMETEFTKQNVKPLLTGAVFGAAFICKNDISLYHPTELKGLKVMTNDIVLSEFINGMGGAAVDHAVTDMYSDLSNGVVDCALNGANIAKIFGAISVCKCLYKFDNDLSTHIKTTCINLDTWNSFDETLQKIFNEELGDVMYEEYMDWVELMETDQWKSFEEAEDFNVYTITDDLIPEWQEAIKPYADKQLEQLRPNHPELDQAKEIWRNAIDSYYENHK